MPVGLTVSGSSETEMNGAYYLLDTAKFGLTMFKKVGGIEYIYNTNQTSWVLFSFSGVPAQLDMKYVGESLCSDSGCSDPRPPMYTWQVADSGGGTNMVVQYICEQTDETKSNSQKAAE